jgi:type I restriction enzyme M protein
MTATSTTIVQQGKLLDFIDQATQREETPEEYVRQEIAKSLVREYGYPRTDFEVEFRMRVGSGRPRADVVIFDAGTAHGQEHAYIIVECKNKDVKASARRDGVGQLHSYMSSCPNVQYGMWTNGTERHCYRSVTEGGTRLWVEIPDLPNFGETEADRERPTFDQLKPASSDALLFAFRRCHNYIAGNQGLQKPEAFWELLKLIFCKIHDERSSDQVQFYAPTGSGPQGLSGQLGVKRRIDQLFKAVKGDFPQIFKKSDEIELNNTVLSYIVGQLQSYTLLDSDVDVKGKAYEEIVGSNLRGDRGEFFTPRNMCQMAVSMLNPQETHRILDPACGTGGFLITAMNHVVKTIHDSEIEKWGGEKRAQRTISARTLRFMQNIVGLDLNPNLVKAAKMNMVMNNDGSGGLHQANSLASPATWSDEVRSLDLFGSVDILITNPPFGSKIPIDDPSVLEGYDLGHGWSYDLELDRWTMTENLQKSQPPEILFIERCVRLLKPGTGRAAIVVPDGILSSPGLGYVRQWILTQTRILASVDMHPDAFQPKNSVQTSVIVLERKTDEQIAIEQASGGLADYPIFMALAFRVGHDKRGKTTYVRDSEGYELVEEVEEPVREIKDGKPIIRLQRSLRKKVDDNTMDVARKFREWLESLE